MATGYLSNPRLGAEDVGEEFLLPQTTATLQQSASDKDEHTYK
jgi:hypothetical protein